MPFQVPIDDARRMFPEFQFITALTPSEQKAAFHVKDKDGNDLCLKIISPHFEMDRLQREVQALQSIAHTNVVGLKEYTFSATPGNQRHYMIEEFIAGSDLTQKMTPGRPLPPKETALLFAKICDGLSALRAKKIVHRDLKPSNIRVRPNDDPVVIDFGLARMLDMPDLTRTGDGADIGTPNYFSPEQFNGTKRDIDHRTDLFAVGVMLYQALTGVHPFWTRGMSYGVLRDNVCNSLDYEKDTTFQSLPAPLKMICSKLLEKNRANRPAEPQQVATILRKIAEGL